MDNFLDLFGFMVHGSMNEEDCTTATYCEECQFRQLV